MGLEISQLQSKTLDDKENIHVKDNIILDHVCIYYLNTS